MIVKHGTRKSRKTTRKPRKTAPAHTGLLATKKDLTKMPLLVFVRFCIDALKAANPSRMIHHFIIRENYDPGLNGVNHEIISGFCGCAIGTICLADGKAAQERMWSWDAVRSSTYDWKAGAFAGWFLAALSRRFEGDRGPLHEPYIHPWGSVATPAEVEDCLWFAEKVYAILTGAEFTPRETPAIPFEPSTFHRIDSRFGSLDLMPSKKCTEFTRCLTRT